ncbi:hypothetical protein VPH35_003085 [Triticum aestivum]
MACRRWISCAGKRRREPRCEAPPAATASPPPRTAAGIRGARFFVAAYRSAPSPGSFSSSTPPPGSCSSSRPPAPRQSTIRPDDSLPRPSFS